MGIPPFFLRVGYSGWSAGCLGRMTTLARPTAVARTAEFLHADQSDLGCPVPFEKRIPFSFDPNHFTTLAVSFHQRGVSRSSRTRGGMRWPLMAPLTNGAEADGEVVWS